MLKKPKTKLMDTNTPKTSKLPKLKAIKTDWDLKRLYYKSDTDPQIEADIKDTEQAYLDFEKKYRSLAWTKSSNTVISAVANYIKLIDTKGAKPLHYLSYRTTLNSQDLKAEKLLNKLEERLTKVGNRIIFFEIALAKLPKDLQQTILSDAKAKLYHYYLKQVFDDAKYQLSEPEEKILNLKSTTSRGMWINATQKILNKKTISWKGKPMPINGALMQFENLPHKERHQMWNKIVPVLEAVGEVAENELVALVTDKKVNDELRGFKKPYSATTKGYDSTDETLETLVRVMETKGYELSSRFFKLKKKLLKKDLTYIDRNEPIGKAPKINFAQSVDIVREVFYGFNPMYGGFFDEMLSNGHFDVYPKAGKGGGAFCSSGVNLPTIILLNHNDSIDSLRTLAHEMGHAIHAYRSKTQPSLYEGHTILTAETASTFFESLVADHLIAQASDKDKLVYLHSSIADRLMTMVMCIARFKAELEIHNTIREQGGMDYKEMATVLSKHLGKYAGPAIKTDYRDGLSVVAKVHYRSNFYQYSYSFGEIGSSIMRRKYKEDKSYAGEVDTFLTLGESDTVENIFKAVGIDMSQEKTFLEGLQLISDDIDLFEKLTK
jgi:oligoendopeptidase F